MPTLTSVNAQWTNSLAVTDADSRRINAGTFVGDGTALGARGGIVRHGDTSLLVTVNGSDQITVQPGVVAIPSSVALAGVYMASFGAVTGPGAGTAIATRNSTNPRIDLVVADTAAGIARIRTVDGTPSSSPVAPSLPPGSVELGRLNVPVLGGGAVTVDSTWRTYAAGLGGALYVENVNRLPGSGNQKRQRAVALDTGKEHVFDGSWREFGEFNQLAALAAADTVSGSAITAGTRLQIQSRTVTGTTNATGDLQIVFPVAFASGLIAVIPALGDPVNVTTAKYLQPYASSSSFFWVRVYNSAGAALASTNVRVNYIAVGW